MYMASLLCVHTIVFCVETTRVQWCKLCCPILVHFLKSPKLELGVYKSGNHVVNSSLQYSLLVVNGYFWSCVYALLRGKLVSCLLSVDSICSL